MMNENDPPNNRPPLNPWRLLLGTLAGMVTYWSLVSIGMELMVAHQHLEAETAGPMFFLLVLGPFAFVACATVLVLAIYRKGFPWICGGGAGVALAWLALAAAC